jgi:hypothetical protein
LVGKILPGTKLVPSEKWINNVNYYALSCNYISVLDWLEKQGWLVKEKLFEEKGMSGLIDACKKGHLDVIRWVNDIIPIPINFCYLIVKKSCKYGCKDLLNWLLSTKINLGLAEIKQYLVIAEQYKREDVIRYLSGKLNEYRT